MYLICIFKIKLIAYTREIKHKKEIIKIRIKCSYCKAKLIVDKGFTGDIVECVNCKEAFTVVPPHLTKCRFGTPPPTYKQFEYALILGINPNKLNKESITDAIYTARKNEAYERNWIKEYNNKGLYEYIYNRGPLPSWYVRHSFFLNFIIFIISIIIICFIISYWL